MATVSKFLHDKATKSAAKRSEEFGEEYVGGTQWLEEKRARNENQLETDRMVSVEKQKELSNATIKGKISGDKTSKAVEETVMELLKPQRDAAAYEQAKTAAKQEKAQKGYAENMAQQEKDRATMEADLAEFEKWPEEDRRKLQIYIENGAGSINSLIGAVTGKATADAFMAQKELEEKYGAEIVGRMMRSVSRSKNEKFAGEMAALGKQTGDEHAVLGSTATVPMNLIGAIYAPLGYLGEAVRGGKGQYSTLDPNNLGNLPNVYSNAVRGQVAQNISGDKYDEQGNQIKEGGALRQGGAYLYQGVMSLADSIARATFGGGAAGGAVLAASGSFSQAISDASAAGATPAQAVLLGVATAGMEYLTEKIPMDEVFKVAKSGKTNVLKQMFKQAGVEITTEELSLFGTLAAEAAIMQEQSSYKQQIAEAMANGASYAEAKKMADDAIWEQVKETAIVSGISGGISGGGSAVVGNARNGNAQTDVQTPTQTEVTAEAAAAPAEQVQQVEATTPPQQEETAAEAAQQPTVFDNVVAMAMASESGATNSMANTVLNDPVALEQFVQQTGRTVEGTKSEQRKAVKDAINEIAAGLRTQNTETATETQQQPKERQAAQDVADMLMGKEKPAQPEVAAQANEQVAAPVAEQQESNQKALWGKNDEWRDMTDNAVEATALAMKEVNPAYYDAYMAAGDSGQPSPVIDAVINASNDVRQQSISPMAAATVINEVYQQYGEEGLNQLSNAAGNLHQSVLNRMKAADSTRGNAAGIKGTGAAEQNFSGKAQYQDLLTDDNVQPDRTTDVRPMELPKKDVNGNNVSATAANVYGSKFTPDEFASLIETESAKGGLSYAKITNDQATEDAKENITRSGSWEAAYTQWAKEVDRGNAGAEISARGALLLNHAAQSVDKAQWRDVLHEMQKLGTNTAQGLQAMRLIRELSPPDKLEFAKATIRKMVADMKLRNDIVIDESLLDAYQNAETDEQRNAIMSDIQQNVADQIPSTWLDKWNALRYMNMLGNLKTNVRNVAGNVANTVMYRLKDQVAALAEDVVSALNKDFQKTKAHTVSKELMEFAKNDFENVKSVVGSGGKYGARNSASGEFAQGVMDKRTIFKSDNKVVNAALKPAELYRKGTNWMMNNEYFGDEAFGRGAYARALAGYLKANGVTDPSKASDALLDKARAYAVKQAQETTFHDNSTLAKIAGDVQKATGVVGQAVMPFTKTPANVLTRAMEFSPLGILDTAQKTARMALSKTKATDADNAIGKIARGGMDITGADIADSLAKNFTGSLLFALGALLRDYGWLRGGPDEDDEKAAFDKMNGLQNYSLQFTLNGKEYTYTFDWLTPAAMPMFMGAEFGKLMANAANGISWADMEKAFTSIGDPLVQMSMLQGLNDTLSDIKYAENNLGQFFLNAAVSYLTQGLTNTLAGQIERSTEKNRMTTYVDKESNVPQWLQKEIGKASQKIPGWDYQQTEYLNAWGDTQKNEGDLAYNLLSPGYMSETVDTPLTQELHRLSEKVEGDVYPESPEKTITYKDTKGVEHENQPLTAEQYQRYAQTQGQTAKRILDSLVASDSYKSLTDAEKANTIKAVYEYAAEKGKQAALGKDYYSTADAWIGGTKESDLNAFMLQGSKKVLNSVVKNVVNNLTQDWEVSKAAKDDLEASWQTFDKMSKSNQDKLLEAVTGDTARYLLARQDNVSTESWMTVTDSIKSLKPEKGKDNVSASQEYAAIAQAKNVSEKEKDALMRAYMPDYDPDNGKTQQTEIKYDYMRQVMKLSPEKAVAALRISGESGKKDEKKKRWIKLGLSQAQADTLWNLLNSSSEKEKIDVVKWSKTKKK